MENIVKKISNLLDAYGIAEEYDYVDPEAADFHDEILEYERWKNLEVGLILI